MSCGSGNLGMAFSGQEHNPHRELESRDGGPLPMQFFSTWEVRKVPVNCMSRLCTLNITKLVLLRPIESDLQSVVLAISMKVCIILLYYYNHISYYHLGIIIIYNYRHPIDHYDLTNYKFLLMAY